MSNVCLGNINDIADGQAKGFDPALSGNDTVFVVRQGEQLYAFQDICPHYNSTSLPWKRHQYLDASSSYIVCAAHGALFDIQTGLCVRGPCAGQSLNNIPVEVDENQNIWLDLAHIKELEA